MNVIYNIVLANYNYVIDFFVSREEIDVVEVVVDQHTEADIEENEKLGFQEMKTLMILI